VNKKKKKPENVIAENRRARFNFELTNKFEAGVSLEGWEVRSIRLGKAQIAESYVLLKDSEAWLIGCHINPLANSNKENCSFFIGVSCLQIAPFLFINIIKTNGNLFRL